MTNNGCERCCETINRPAYIVLFKGDDSDFEGNQSVDIVIDTELDTTGMKAHFRFMDFVQDFDSIPENKTLSLVFPNAKTSEFPLGAADATLRFEDASGKFRTVSNRIHIVVTNSVHEAYDNEDSQSITVTVKGTVTWDMIEGKPPIPDPVTIDPALSQTSENPVQNKVVSKALYTGFTEWRLTTDNLPQGYSFVGASFVGDSWIADIAYDDGVGPVVVRGVDVGGTQDSTSITFTYVNTTNTMSRHLITPTKTSQLTNDGPSSGPNVGHPFATTDQIPAPVDISGKLDGAAVANDWSEAPPSIYQEGDVVTYNGSIWMHRSTSTNEDPPSLSNADWRPLFIHNWKQDRLTFDNAPTQDSGNPVKSGGVYTALEGKVSTNTLASHTYDFSTNVGLYTGVRDLILALGGSVTNFPAINGGN